MNFGAGSFFASLIVSSVGFVAFMYGKRQSRAPQLVVGLVLMAYPYFIDSVVPMLVIFAVLIGMMVAAIKLGY